MGATQFVPIEPDLIDEGEFMEELAGKLNEAFLMLRKHRLRFDDKAKKASVEVIGKVKLTVMDTKEGNTAVTWEVQVKPPKRPAETSFAIDGYDQHSEPALLVKAGGSDKSDARQMKFATSDGRNVDQESGEVEPR